MLHEVVLVGPLKCNCSIFGEPESGQAIVIDPGDEIEIVTAILNKHSLHVVAIVITHAHIDHIGGAAKLQRMTGAPIHMNEDDLGLRSQLGAQASWLGMKPPEIPEIDVFLRDGDTVTMQDGVFHVLHTPGHTQGSISLHVPQENKLVAGDTLFRDSIGRTDLPGGDSRQILGSIQGKLLTLDDSVIVIPGHGPETTIGREREMNYFLRNL